jgi:hypothetical protein
MIHFDFIVNDEDAENIFDCINAEISKCQIKKLLTKSTEAEIVWFDKHVIYLKALKTKMKNHKEEIC